MFKLAKTNDKETRSAHTMSPSNYWHARKLLASRRSNKNHIQSKHIKQQQINNKNNHNNADVNNKIACDIVSNDNEDNDDDNDNSNYDGKNCNLDSWPRKKSQFANNVSKNNNNNNNSNNELLLTSKLDYDDLNFDNNNGSNGKISAIASAAASDDHVIAIPTTHANQSQSHNHIITATPNQDIDKHHSNTYYQNNSNGPTTTTKATIIHIEGDNEPHDGRIAGNRQKHHDPNKAPQFSTTDNLNNLHQVDIPFVTNTQIQDNDDNQQLAHVGVNGNVLGGPSAGANAVVGVGGTVTTVSRGHRKTAPLPRLVAKNGTVNLFLDNIDRRQYMRDLFTTMIDIKWRYNLAAAALGFVISWLFFAIIWYLVLYLHGDLDHENEPNWSPCIVNVNSFSSALLFSIETQSTLGFGSRIISVECPSAIVIFCAQLIFGVVIECLIVGMVFAKLSRPAKRSQTIMFSKMATISLREGRLCLIFRVGDVRSKSHIIGATIRVSLVSHKVTLEGEVIPFYHHQLDAKIDGSRNNLLLIWPVLVVHEINELSPLFHLNAKQLAEFKFEIITVLEGTIESTGQSIQVRSSYLPSEVKWGYRFEQIVSTHGFGRYAQTIIDYNKFNRISEVADMPQCSSADYEQTKSLLEHVAQAKGLKLDARSHFVVEPNNNESTNYNRNHGHK